jgi:fatty acid omega-hydroxylase
MSADTAFANAMKYENRWNPYPYFDELRMESPVTRLSNGLFVVTGYEELQALTHDPHLSSDMRNSPLAPSTPGEAKPASAGDVYGTDPSMIASDPPDHDRMRRQSMQHFGPPHSPNVIPEMESVCETILNGLLDKVKGKTRFDVVDDYAYPLPVTVIFKIMGVPMEMEPQVHKWVAAAMEGVDFGPEASTPEQKERQAKGQAATAEFKAYFAGMVDGFLKKPGDGMISKMVNEPGAYGKMPLSEVVSNIGLLLIAGHDSTVNLISHTVLTALRNPETIELLRSRPDLVPGAVEETLRLQSSVQFFPTRSTLADIEVGGTVIPKGSAVFMLYGAANRDPKRFPDPNKFDPQRPDNEHLGWGGGIHVCFGGQLARLEVNTAFQIFLRRVRNPRLVVDPPPYRRNQIFRGPQHLLIDIDGIED